MRAAGRPYDPSCLDLFDTLFSALNREVFAAIADPAPAGLARENFAFFESYFSNYIEGTTFTVAEAESIVFDGRIIENRSADSHASFSRGQGSPFAARVKDSHRCGDLAAIFKPGIAPVPLAECESRRWQHVAGTELR